MAKKTSDRDKMAHYYARRHLHADPGTTVIYYFPKGAPSREIRLLEVNRLMVARDAAPLEPFDLAIDVGVAVAKHQLLVVDVTPAQWEKIGKKELPLPAGWCMEDAVEIRRPAGKKSNGQLPAELPRTKISP